jgi:hypothetical protein
MKISPVITAILAVAITVTVIGCRKRSVSNELKEFSTSFDLQNLEPFLARVSALIPEGFSGVEIEKIVESVKNMKPDEEREL